MRKFITLKIETDNVPVISELLNRKSTGLIDSGYWEMELIENVGNELSEILLFYEDAKPTLLKNNIDTIDVSIWILYEYEQQCNLEFDLVTLKALSKLGIQLCISCWEK